MKQIIKRLIDNDGMVAEEEMLERLETECPSMPVVVKWACQTRSIHLAGNVRQVIRNEEKNNLNEYAREIFISTNQLDTLRAAM
jgi:hypothetical protein